MSGGCIAGPGTIASMNRVRREVQKFMKASHYPTPLENEHIKEAVETDINELMEEIERYRKNLKAELEEEAKAMVAKQKEE